MKQAKIYKLIMHRDGYVAGRRPMEYEGTVETLVKDFSYTLECGKSYEHEKGNSKINLHPTTIRSLISNVNKAMNNSAANGYSGKTLELVSE